MSSGVVTAADLEPDRKILEPDRKIKGYDERVDITSGQWVYDLLVSYCSGDVWAPKVAATASSDLLEAAEQSLTNRGGIVVL